MSQKLYLPARPPAEPAAASRPELTEDQQKMQQTVQQHFEDASYKPTGSDNPLSEDEKMWLSYECTLRYLRASKWKADVAIRRCEQTLIWRREYGIYDAVTAEHVEPEAVTGKQIIFGFDVHGRPALYLLPSRQNTAESPRQVQHVVFMLERCIDLMPPGVETLALLIDYADKAKNPSFATARAVLSILQEHYPERLGLALILNVPFLLSAFYKLITPFIDPVTRTKMKFNPRVVQDGIFLPDMVLRAGWGGAVEFEYAHDKYWPALMALCKERTDLWKANWLKLGGKVGLKEADYKTGPEVLPTSEAEGDVLAPATEPQDSAI